MSTWREIRAWRVARGVMVVTIGVALFASACIGPTAPRGGGATAGPETPGAAFPPAASTIEEGPGGYRVEIDPADFVGGVDNPYFPLEPGTLLRLEGVTDQGREVDTITVLPETREVMGVTTTVVKDVVTVNGELAEKTWDWFAQDREGNVWYFGEDTAEYENGKVVSRSGAWEAGVDGALPGIVMPAAPSVTDSHRAEYYRGEAEDMWWVVETGGSKEVPQGTFEDVVRTLEWSPLEPKIVVEKYHAPGVGMIAERALSGGTEIFELVEITRAG